MMALNEKPQIVRNSEEIMTMNTTPMIQHLEIYMIAPLLQVKPGLIFK